MPVTTSRFASALCATALDTAVVGRYAPLLWETWGPVAWARIGLLLLAGALAFTLMDIWYQTVGIELRIYQLQRDVQRSSLLPATTEMEGLDV